jgi:hypothetical protein
VQEIVLLQAQAQAHITAFGEVKWELLAAEQFGGRRQHHKLRTVYNMLQRAEVGDEHVSACMDKPWCGADAWLWYEGMGCAARVGALYDNTWQLAALQQ